VEGASCPFHKGLIFAINVRLKFIEVEGASYPFNKRLIFAINIRLKYI
jgi:hypothetical protein